MTKERIARRHPHRVPGGVLWWRLLPLFPAVVKEAAVGLASKIVPSQTLFERTDEQREHTRQRAQQIYFRYPGLDTLTVRRLAKAGRRAAEFAALYLRSRVTFGLDGDGRSKKNLGLLPTTGYETLMVGGLVAGRTFGFLRPGILQKALWWDSGRTPRMQLPPGHPEPKIRRFDMPRSLGDLAADIDDMYWAQAWGAPVKVIRVGPAAEAVQQRARDGRRWIVVIPGTDHPEFESQQNPADTEANMEEELNIPSDMRLGVIRAVRDAMRQDGLGEEEMLGERVMAVGHSQGGIIAAALASVPLKDVGFDVDRVLTMGAPARRFKLRPGVKMVAIEHLQDIVPALDGTPRVDVDQRVTFTRRLTMPINDPLYYAHSSATYTDTVRQLEKRVRVVPWGRLPETVLHLQEYLLNEDAPSRMFQYYVWRDHLVGPPSPSYVFDVGQPEDWKAVTFEADVALPEEIREPLGERIEPLVKEKIEPLVEPLKEKIKRVEKRS